MYPHYWTALEALHNTPNSDQLQWCVLTQVCQEAIRVIHGASEGVVEEGPLLQQTNRLVSGPNPSLQGRGET